MDRRPGTGPEASIPPPRPGLRHRIRQHAERREPHLLRVAGHGPRVRERSPARACEGGAFRQVIRASGWYTGDVSIRDTMLQVVNSLAANMAAGPIAAVLARAAHIATGTSSSPLASGDLAQAAIYGTLFVGASYWQVSQGKIADRQMAERFQRLSQAVSAIVLDAERAKVQLVELALEIDWVREAISDGVETLTAELRKQVSDRLGMVGVGVDQIQSTLDELAHLQGDTNLRVREAASGIQRTEESIVRLLAGQARCEMRNATAEQVEELRRLILSLRPNLIATQEILDRDLVGGVEVLMQKAERGDALARRAITNHDPQEATDALLAERHRLVAAGAMVSQRFKEAEDSLDRSIAAIAFSIGRISDAEAALLRLLGRHPGDLEAMATLGELYLMRGEHLQADRLFRQIEVDAPDDEWRGVASMCLGGLAWSQGRLQDAEDHIQEAIRLNKATGRLRSLAAGVGNLGLVYKARNDLVTAEQLCRQANEIARKSGSAAAMATSLGNLGVIEKMKGRLEEAKVCISEALAMEERSGHLEGIANQLGNLGLVELSLGNAAGASGLLARVLAIESHLGRAHGLANAHNALGLLSMHEREYKKARYHHKAALAIHTNLGRTSDVARQYSMLALAALGDGDVASSLEFWSCARERFAAIGDQEEALKVQTLISMFGGVKHA